MICMSHNENFSEAVIKDVFFTLHRILCIPGLKLIALIELEIFSGS